MRRSRRKQVGGTAVYTPTLKQIERERGKVY